MDSHYVPTIQKLRIIVSCKNNKVMRNEIIFINSSINTEVFKLDHSKKRGK